MCIALDGFSDYRTEPRVGFGITGAQCRSDWRAEKNERAFADWTAPRDGKLPQMRDGVAIFRRDGNCTAEVADLRFVRPAIGDIRNLVMTEQL